MRASRRPRKNGRLPDRLQGVKSHRDGQANATLLIPIFKRIGDLAAIFVPPEAHGLQRDRGFARRPAAAVAPGLKTPARRRDQAWRAGRCRHKFAIPSGTMLGRHVRDVTARAPTNR